jgi:hypothetical protein
MINEARKEAAIEFLKWAANRNIELSLGIIVDNYGTYDSMDEYYNLFTEQKLSEGKVMG